MTDHLDLTKVSGLELPFKWFDGVAALTLLVLVGVPIFVFGLPNVWAQVGSLTLLAAYLSARGLLDRHNLVEDRTGHIYTSNGGCDRSRLTAPVERCRVRPARNRSLSVSA